MALLWFDGFDSYRANDSVFSTESRGCYDYYDSRVRVSSMPILGGFGVYMGTTASVSTYRGILEKNLPSAKASGVLGVGAHVYASTSISRGTAWFCFKTSADQVYRVGGTSAGFVRVSSGNGNPGSIIGTSDNPVFIAGQLMHVEVKLVIAGGTSGSIEVRVDGVQQVLVTGINTAGTSISTIGLLSPMDSGSGALDTNSYWIDNLYIWDETGLDNNDWLGERNVYTLLPNEDTIDADWTLSTGTDGYALINKVPPVDSSYIEGGSINDTSTFGFSELPSIDIGIIGVRQDIRGLKTGTAVTEISTGFTGHLGPNLPLVQDQSTTFPVIHEKNPSTGDDWTPGEVNSAQVQVKRIS